MNQNAIAEITAATIRPRYSAFMILPPDLALTKKQPMSDATIDAPPSTSGYTTARSAIDGISSAPSSIVATIVTAYVSNRSAAMPAQSPTLSPTLSAITAGLRGSSSGMPASTLPTRSAPTSAPLVKMPPPSRAKIEMSDPPNPRPTSGLMTSLKAAPGAAEAAMIA